MANFQCHLILLLAVWCCAAKAAKIDRDIILVPNEVQQVPGKAMLYESKPNAFEQFRNRVWNNSVDDISEENDEPLWLGPLKYALFLMLSNKVNGTESDAIAEKAIQQAEFIGLHGVIETNTKFGDVINLANGKIELDRNLNGRIVEQVQNCMNRCWNEITDGLNTTAFWSIYKIRHRDDKRQFRYEWKIMIRKLKILRKDNRRNIDHDHSIVRSFILRDDDYPKFFPGKMVVDGHGNEPRMEKRIFTTGYDRINVPFKLDEQNNAKLISNRNGYYEHEQNENLNTGEYYSANGGYISKPSDPVEYFQRPAESPQYGAQDNQQQQQQQHHHYLLNNDQKGDREEALLFKGPQYEKVTAYPPAASYPSPIQHSTQIQNPIHPNGGYRESYPPLQSNGPLHFPQEYNRIRFDPIGQTKFRGPYDDNRESILDEEPQHAYHNQNVNVNGHSNLRFPSNNDNIRDIGPSNTPRPYQSSFNFVTSPASVVFPNNHQNFNEIFNAGFKANYNRQLFNQLYRFESSNPRNVNGAKANFAASIPYQENSYSEPDPYYHGQYSVTPYSSIPKSIDASTLVSQLPYDYGSDGSVLTSTESHHLQKVTTIENGELSQTTPLTFDDTSAAIQNQYYHSTEYFDQNNKHNNQQYDSIDAQLPAPETGTIASSYDNAVEYALVNLNRNDEIQTEANSFSPTDTNSEPTTMESQVTTRRADETTINTLTEQTSWKPKRSRYKQSDKVKEQKVERDPVIVKKKQSTGNRKRKVYREKSSTRKPAKDRENVNSTSTTTTSTTTMKSTTIASNHDEEEPRTSQSVHKTVSVHIGEKITVLPNAEKEINHEIRGSTKYKSKISKVKKV